MVMIYNRVRIAHRPAYTEAVFYRTITDVVEQAMCPTMLLMKIANIFEIGSNSYEICNKKSILIGVFV